MRNISIFVTMFIFFILSSIIILFVYCYVWINYNPPINVKYDEVRDTSNTEVFQTLSGRTDLIEIYSPKPKESIHSPVQISGRARGTWFFEGSFPVVLVDWDGLIIAEGYATALDDWMTEEFVPFSSQLEFQSPTYRNNGTLILHKDNPSGLVKYDDALEIPVFFD